MTPGSCPRGHFAMGMFPDGCEAPSALSLRLPRHQSSSAPLWGLFQRARSSFYRGKRATACWKPREPRLALLGQSALNFIQMRLKFSWNALRPALQQATRKNCEHLNTGSAKHAHCSRKLYEYFQKLFWHLGTRSSLIALEVKRIPWPSHSITCEGRPSSLIALFSRDTSLNLLVQ